jgi:hypothetical protein
VQGICYEAEKMLYEVSWVMLVYFYGQITRLCSISQGFSLDGGKLELLVNIISAVT